MAGSCIFYSICLLAFMANAVMKSAGLTQQKGIGCIKNGAPKQSVPCAQNCFSFLQVRPRPQVPTVQQLRELASTFGPASLIYIFKSLCYMMLQVSQFATHNSEGKNLVSKTVQAMYRFRHSRLHDIAHVLLAC